MSRRIITKSDLNPPWPLAVSNMTIWDRLKIAKWLLTEDHWTQGAVVREYEERWERYTGAPHVIMTSNGSMSNELIALRRKWELERSGDWPRRNKVVFPVVNWISSVSPWINLGFEPIFIDVWDNMTSANHQVANAMNGRDDVAAVFYTSLLGFTGGIDSILTTCRAADIPLYLDNCEASFSSEGITTGTGRISDTHVWITGEQRHISNIVTSSTSLFFSHHTSGQGESGLLFCQTQDEADWYRMARNHGMTRGVDVKYRNPDVDPAFDFHLMGSNYRSTNLNAYMCGLDLDRAIEFGDERRTLSALFADHLHFDRFEHPHWPLQGAVPLSLPIVVKPNDYRLIDKVKAHLDARGIERRGIVGGNLLYQTCFKQYGNPKDYPRADYLHHNGVYIGLHRGVTRDMVMTLGAELSSL